MKKLLLIVLAVAHIIPCLMAQTRESSDVQIMPFGGGGQVKMLYDARQRPQAVYLKDKLHIVFNGGGIAGESKSSKKKAESKSMAVTYDPLSRKFSEIVTLGKKYSSDHHDGPVIWADMEEKLHVFYGWHKDDVPGTHLISNEPANIGRGLKDWSDAPSPAPKMSYLWVSRIYDRKQLLVYRTGKRHYSSWTYRITSDNGKTWQGPKNDVIDLNIKGGMDTDWSVYTAKAVSKDGNYLHLGFIAYDDYMRPRSPKEIASGKLDGTREQNPLYDNRKVGYKYNLYYVKIDLRTHKVVNDMGELLQTPIDLATANSKCMIWDTKWRGGGIVPSMMVDDEERVSFLHNLSEIEHEKSLGYHYVRLENGEWKHTRITDSNHHWNCGHLARSADGVLRAYVITGDGYLNVEGNMDRYGGGNIEEWISRDQGNTWAKERDLTPDPTEYPGWKYNNIQAVKRADGTLVDGMLLFYGWEDASASEAKAFLLHEE